jgi:integrase
MAHSNPFEGCVIDCKIETWESGRSFTENEARTVLQSDYALCLSASLGGSRLQAIGCVHTGCRRVEATQLRACDIDLARKIARIVPEAAPSRQVRSGWCPATTI